MDNIIAQLDQVVMLTRDFLANPSVLPTQDSLHALQLMSDWNIYLSKLLETIKQQTADERKMSFHELCRPLNGILGCFELWLHQNTLEESLKKHVEDLVAEVADVTESVKHVVKEMGVYSYWCGD
jgi:hypothetical protein